MSFNKTKTKIREKLKLFINFQTEVNIHLVANLLKGFLAKMKIRTIPEKLANAFEHASGNY